jgi:hypothetical protein
MNIRQLVDKMMDDREFYERLKKDPAAALAQHNLSEEQIEALRKLDFEHLEHLARLFGPEKFIT